MGLNRNSGSLLCALTALCFSCVPAFAQNSTPLSLDQLLLHLGQGAGDLHRKLPNFTCNESALSQELEQGKVRRHATFTTTIRAQRNAKGVLEEQLGTLTYDVNVFSAIFHHAPATPLMVRGGFSQALDYFSTDDQTCFDYRLSGSRIDFTSLPVEPPACKNSGTEGFALLDENSNVTHLERTVRLEDAVARGQIRFAAIDFAPVELDGQIFRLSHHVVAEMPGDNGILRRFTADFSNCKLFTATVTIEPATP